MIPAPDSEFLLRLETNEMIERERFTSLLSAIEDAIRRNRSTGPDAYLLVGAIRRGSVEVVLAIGGLVTTVVMTLPSFLVDLKQLARDRRTEPNQFAVAIADVMAFDGTSRVDFVYRDKTVTIHKSEVPFVQRIAFGREIRTDRQQTIRPEELQADENAEPQEGQVEDEDQDWVPTLEARDAPPRESGEGPSGYVTSISLVGEFENIERNDGSREVRFVPRDSTLAPYFVVTSNAYEAEPMEMVQYQVMGNVTLEGDGPGTIEVMSIAPPDDALLTFRS